MSVNVSATFETDVATFQQLLQGLGFTGLVVRAAGFVDLDFLSLGRGKAGFEKCCPQPQAKRARILGRYITTQTLKPIISLWPRGTSTYTPLRRRGSPTGPGKHNATFLVGPNIGA